MAAHWNPSLYQGSHAFVWEYGRDLLQLLAPQAGERILDIGCGTGQLAAEIARAGAHVTAIDNSAAMIEQARRNFPEVRFELADARSLPYREQFEAVFSNAALHWVSDPDAAAAGIARALKPGGRFVAELGGKGNNQLLQAAVFQALGKLGVTPEAVRMPWFFPSIGEYAPILERYGLEVTFAALFDRPTRLDNGARGLADWVAMFGSCWTEALSIEQRPEFQRLLEAYAAPGSFRDGCWFVDYRRLRLVAMRTHRPQSGP
ncbi:MAG TPA: methyltransferase domain-containing protein [Bryobacteraceae bacterium]|nr:methyltransferase domain-containing protein [Bryobacteraceae bacterium]